MRIQEFDYSVNIPQVIQWQYSPCPAVTSLITQKQAYYQTNQTDFWNDWYTNVFNLITANNFGLSVWCIILDIPYFIDEEPATKPVWGFNINPSENSNVNFTRGTFAGESSSGRIVLTTEEQRLLLRLRYFKLVSYGDIIFTNNFLNLLFNDPDGLYVGGAWVLDNFNMTQTYVFNCPISDALLQAIELLDILPRPLGIPNMYEVTGFGSRGLKR